MKERYKVTHKSDYIISLILAVLAYNFISPEALDLGRYYTMAESYDINLGFNDFIIQNLQSNFDFIYYLSFFIIRKLSLPVELVNGIFVGFYYYSAIMLFRLYSSFLTSEDRKSYTFKYLLLFFLTSVGIILIFTISRNVAALSFFFLGFFFLLIKNKSFFFFWVLSILTHTGMLFYISLFSLFYFVLPRPSKMKKIKVVSLTIIALFSKYWISFLFNLVLKISFFEKYSRYANYLNLDYVSVYNLGRIELLSYLIVLIILFFCFYFIDIKSRTVWASFGIYLFLLANINSSAMFVQRSLLFLFPFIGIIAIVFYKENSKKPVLMLFFNIITGLSILSFFATIYSYREVFF